MQNQAMREPECFVCSDCPLICAIYEAALKQGLEADWKRVEGSNNLWMVEVYDITRKDFEKLVFEVSKLPYLVVVPDGTVQQLNEQLTLPIAA